MPKVYLDTNVYDAAIQRLEYVFTEFDNVYFSVSGGKDSSVLVQLAHKVAKSMNKKFSILYIDLEAQYMSTVQHVEDLIEKTAETTDEVYWACLPFSLVNAVSSMQPEWQCWDEKDKKIWVRPMPTNKHIINEHNHTLPWFEKYVTTFEDFTLLFAEWFNKRKGGNTACGIGIRSDESFNRFRTITSTTKVKFRGKNWTTKVYGVDGGKMPVYNVYPLYDWSTKDIWACVAKEKFLANPVYDAMWKNGIGIHQQRICQPFGSQQRQGLDQFRAIDPVVWEKLLTRVNGVNFGNIYARTSLLGHLKSNKPDHLSWQQYTVFLLESLGLVAPEVLGYYYSKIKYFIRWYQVNGPVELRDFHDSAPTKKNSHPSWERIARSVEKNDFWLSSLSFAATKEGMGLLKQLQGKYNLFGDGKMTAAMKRAQKELER